MKTNRFTGIFRGIVTGIMVSLFYGLITIGPVNFEGRISVVFALLLTAALVDLRVLKSGAPWYLPNQTTLGGYHSTARPFTVGLSWGMMPIMASTMIYFVLRLAGF